MCGGGVGVWMGVSVEVANDSGLAFRHTKTEGLKLFVVEMQLIPKFLHPNFRRLICQRIPIENVFSSLA